MAGRRRTRRPKGGGGPSGRAAGAQGVTGRTTMAERTEGDGRGRPSLVGATLARPRSQRARSLLERVRVRYTPLLTASTSPSLEVELEMRRGGATNCRCLRALCGLSRTRACAPASSLLRGGRHGLLGSDGSPGELSLARQRPDRSREQDIVLKHPSIRHHYHHHRHRQSPSSSSSSSSSSTSTRSRVRERGRARARTRARTGENAMGSEISLHV